MLLIYTNDLIVKKMHFNILLGIEPKLLVAYLAAMQILNMEYVDYATKIIPACLLSGFVIYKWIVFYRKNKDNENDYTGVD